MVFPLDFLSITERKYPGLLSQFERKAGNINIFTFMAQKGVDSNNLNGLYPLLKWKRDKISYSFDRTISAEILEQTQKPDFKIPVMFLSRLPYGCIAISTTPLCLSGTNNPSGSYENYTGNAFIWIEDKRLFSAWEHDTGKYLWTKLDLIDGLTLDDSYESNITDKLKMEFSSDEIQQFKEMFHVEHFREITQLNKDGVKGDTTLDIRDSKYKTFNDIMYLSSIEEALAQRMVHIVLYLNASNTDIQEAEEKLKAGAWASIADIPQTEEPIPRTVRRRAHLHHFWVGPRNEPIAEDIMNPAPGERGLVLYWLPSTEIHKEMADDLPTLIEVDEKSGDLLPPPTIPTDGQ